MGNRRRKSTLKNTIFAAWWRELDVILAEPDGPVMPMPRPSWWRRAKDLYQSGRDPLTAACVIKGAPL